MDSGISNSPVNKLIVDAFRLYLRGFGRVPPIRDALRRTNVEETIWRLL